MNKKINTTPVSDKEIATLTEIYTQLEEPKRSIMVMGANLLLASQNAEVKCEQKEETRDLVVMK